MTSAPPIPAWLRSKMAELGPRWREDIPGHVKQMLDAFASILAEAPKAGVAVERDIAYGGHPRQQLDLFAPADTRMAKPAVLFVHGGAFVAGHRNFNAEVYANVLYYFARHGIVGINMGYRLADDSPYPAATQDVGAVMGWTRAHAAALGIDPRRIFLMGHSAGGAHIASYAYDKRPHPPEGPGIAGLIVLSGRVRVDNLPENPNARKVEAYYGTDASRFEDYSPVSHVDAGSVPTFIAMAQYENPLLDVYSLELAQRLAVAKRRAPPLVWLRGHNHASLVAHLNTAEDDLGSAIRAFIEQPS